MALIDVNKLTWSRSPPMSVMRQAISLLGKHYPYRVAGIYLLNSSGPFQMLWGMIKPLVSKRVLEKTAVLGAIGVDGSGKKSKASDLLDERLSLSYLEESYGGQQPVVTRVDVAAGGP